MPSKWQYHVVRMPDVDGQQLSSRLCEIGDEGWELVAVDMPTGLHWFKRPVEFVQKLQEHLPPRQGKKK